VVYAILMGNGKQFTADTLFPFSQATLAHAARILGTYGIDVEIVGFPAASQAVGWLGWLASSIRALG
jgi:hypothetical protein